MRSVRVDVESTTAPPPAPEFSRRDRSARVGALLVVFGLCAVVIGALHSSETDPLETPSSPTTTVDGGSAAEATTIVEVASTKLEAVAVAPSGDVLRTPSPTADGSLLAVRASFIGGTLVESDDGLRWTEVDSPVSPGNMLAVSNHGSTRYALRRERVGSDHRIAVHRSIDGRRWDEVVALGRDASGTWPTLAAADGRWFVVVAEEPPDADRDRTALHRILSAYAAPDLVSRTCAVRAEASGSLELLDCVGKSIGRIGDNDPARARTLGSLAFLAASAQTIMVWDALGEMAIDHELAVGERVVAATTDERGTALLIVDPLGGIDPSSMTAAAPSTEVLAWRNHGERSRTATPIVADATVSQIANPLAIDDAGRLVAIDSTGLYRTDEMWQTWSLESVLPTPAPPLSVGLGADGEVALVVGGAGSAWIASLDSWASRPRWHPLDLVTDDIVRQVVRVDGDEGVVTLRVDRSGFIGELRSYPIPD